MVKKETKRTREEGVELYFHCCVFNFCIVSYLAVSAHPFTKKLFFIFRVDNDF